MGSGKKWRIRALATVIASLVISQAQAAPAPFTLESVAMVDNGAIPTVFTLDGENQSPPLHWSNPPKGTRSFVILCIDGDVPGGAFVHWVIYNIPAYMTGIKQALPKEREIPGGILQGINDFHDEEYDGTGWDGPQAPNRTHRYTFRIFALDTMLTFKNQASRAMIRKAIEGHTLGQASLTVTYTVP